MNDFDALLKRSFAEALEPADEGFSVQISRAVAHREKTAKVRNAAYTVGMAAAAAAVCYGAYGLMGLYGQEVLATAGLEVARVHGALSGAPSVGGAAQGMLQSFGAGLTQMLLVFVALAGGAVAYRAAQD